MRFKDDEYEVLMAEGSGVLAIWSTTAGIVLLGGGAIGADEWVAWGTAICLVLLELPLIRRLGLRYPGSRLPTSWR